MRTAQRERAARRQSNPRRLPDHLRVRVEGKESTADTNVLQDCCSDICLYNWVEQTCFGEFGCDDLDVKWRNANPIFAKDHNAPIAKLLDARALNRA